MAWNEPGGGKNNNQDPWGSGGNNGGNNNGNNNGNRGGKQGPPDLDEALKKLQVEKGCGTSRRPFDGQVDEGNFIGRQGVNFVEILCRRVCFQAGIRGLVKLGHAGSVPVPAGSRVAADYL